MPTIRRAIAVPPQPPAPPKSQGSLLALGDSIAFGADPNLPDSAPPDLFHSYAEKVGQDEGLTVENLALPGETTYSFISRFGPNNGGWIPDPNNPAERIHDRHLHVDYSGNQLDTAVDYLKANPETRLVTLTLGGNDMLRLMKLSAHGPLPTPVNEVLGLPGQLHDTYDNLCQILESIRAVYKGPIVVTNQYQLDYADKLQSVGAGLLNFVIAKAVEKVNLPGSPATVANDHDAFGALVENDPSAHGSPGKAGLLIEHPPGSGQYDIHPSPEGREVISDVVEAAQGFR